MSQIKDFVNSGFRDSSHTLGTSKFSIGEGKEIEVVKAEAHHSKESEAGGYDLDDSLTITTSKADFSKEYPLEIKIYLAKTALLDSKKWRIKNINDGEYFVTIELMETSGVT